MRILLQHADLYHFQRGALIQLCNLVCVLADDNLLQSCSGLTPFCVLPLISPHQ